MRRMPVRRFLISLPGSSSYLCHLHGRSGSPLSVRQFGASLRTQPPKNLAFPVIRKFLPWSLVS